MDNIIFPATGQSLYQQMKTPPQMQVVINITPYGIIKEFPMEKQTTAVQQQDNPIRLQAYSLPELAKLYSVCDRTLKKWIAPFHSEIGPRIGRFYTIAQVKVIFEKLGVPGDHT